MGSGAAAVAGRRRPPAGSARVRPARRRTVPEHAAHDQGIVV